MALPSVFNFKQWIDEHRHLLKPPVGNFEVYPGHEFIIMVVGGPNSRTDYHVDPAEEFFYQLEGEMVLKVVDDKKIRDISIKAGEIFLLPALVPHSPQRGQSSVGLVVERARKPLETDMFQWYCEKCSSKLYEEKLQMTDIVKQLPPIFERYERKLENRTCRDCAWVMPLRKPAG
ncbi:MAG TPA: 3-hydroxyanthranilate 3,4-dioxygenase [Myxococcota bacterium]|jgi:3-hydroxyanthranilate 3,4-dioxygenase